MQCPTLSTKISVAINTYNHAAFLAQALESVLMQQTDYRYEIVVLDDCSTDGTTEILLSYAARHPGVIRPIVNSTNRGALASAIALLEHLSGDYVAAFDGDDYWIDPAKLQTQVSFLEANPDFVLCGHNCIMRNEWTGTETLRPDGGSDLTLTTRDLIDVHIPAGSMVFRNHLLGPWPDCFRTLAFGDRVLAILLSELGKVRYLSQPMSAYRMHPGGLWSGTYVVDPTAPIPDTTEEGFDKLIEFWQVLGPYFGHRYDDRLQELLLTTRREIQRRQNRGTRSLTPDLPQ